MYISHICLGIILWTNVIEIKIMYKQMVVYLSKEIVLIGNFFKIKDWLPFSTLGWVTKFSIYFGKSFQNLKLVII